MIDVTRVAVANPGSDGRTRAAMPSSAAGRSGRNTRLHGRVSSTSLTPTGFSRGQAIVSARSPHGFATATRVTLDAADIPRGGRVRPCRARRAAGNRPKRFIRARSVIAFELHRISSNNLSRGADVATT
jgi:hypothetical protein